MNDKPFWKSKTFWFNIASGAALLVSQAAGADLTPEEGASFVGVVTFVNLILRLATKGRVTLG